MPYDFIKKAESSYRSGEYDYSKSVFNGTKVPITIICPDHGPFSMTPDSFIYTGGCRKCRNVNPRGYPLSKRFRTSKKPGRPAIRYSFYIHDMGEFIKIGMTKGDVETRRAQIELKSSFTHKLIYHKTFEDERVCNGVEKLIKMLFPMRVAPAGSMLEGLSETTHKKYLQDIIRISELF